MYYRISFLLLILAEFGWSLEWQPVISGEIPLNSVEQSYVSSLGNSYYCEAIYKPDNKTTEVYTGIVHAREKTCEFVTKDHQIKTSTKYSILVKAKGEKDQFVYAGFHDPPPPNAVRCNDTGIENCFLGQSIYGDAICDVESGKIDADKGFIYIVVGHEKSTCPFFSYLTQEKISSSSPKVVVNVLDGK